MMVKTSPHERNNNAGTRAIFVCKLLRKPGQEHSKPFNWPGNLWTSQSERSQEPSISCRFCVYNPLRHCLRSFAVTDTHSSFEAMADGKIINENEETLVRIQSVEFNPARISIADLSKLLGGAFLSGGEAAWIMRNPAIYAGLIESNSTYFDQIA